MGGVLACCSEILQALEQLGDANSHHQGLKVLERASLNLYTSLVPEKSVVAYTTALDNAMKAIRARTARSGGQTAPSSGSGDITIQSGAR